MKKFLTIMFISFLTATATPAFCSAEDAPLAATANPSETPELLLQRLHEIKDMNKENLTTSEKKELRQEVKHIKKELKKNQKGIYLSVGAIIIIILLLILLL